MKNTLVMPSNSANSFISGSKNKADCRVAPLKTISFLQRSRSALLLSTVGYQRALIP